MRNASLVETLFDLGGDFKRKRIQTLREIADITQETIIKNYSRDGGKKSCRGGDQGLGNAGRYCTKAGRASCAKSGERVDNAPNSAEQADERSDRACGGEPGHAFFDSANFFGRGKLHVDSHGTQTLEPGWRRVPGMSSHLKLEFAVTRGIDVGKWGAVGRECLRIRNASRCPENAEELIAPTAKTAEQTKLLKNHSPGDDGKEEKNSQYAAGNPTGLFKNAAEISGEGCNQEK